LLGDKGKLLQSLKYQLIELFIHGCIDVQYSIYTFKALQNEMRMLLLDKVVENRCEFG
jgi:hypothetical protein